MIRSAGLALVTTLGLAACQPATPPAPEPAPAPLPTPEVAPPEAELPADSTGVTVTLGAQTLVVDKAIVMLPPVGRDVSAAFLAVSSTGADDALIAARTPIATTVELHDHVHDSASGAMSMVKVNSVALPAGQTVELKPGGKHVMMFGVTEPLTVGQKVDLTLVFASGAEVLVQATVSDY